MALVPAVALITTPGQFYPATIHSSIYPWLSPFIRADLSTSVFMILDRPRCVAAAANSM